MDLASCCTSRAAGPSADPRSRKRDLFGLRRNLSLLHAKFVLSGCFYTPAGTPQGAQHENSSPLAWSYVSLCLQPLPHLPHRLAFPSQPSETGAKPRPPLVAVKISGCHLGSWVQRARKESLSSRSEQLPRRCLGRFLSLQYVAAVNYLGPSQLP
jgi:hypothetical protein